MTERLRERLGYLSDEFDGAMGGHLRSSSPNNRTCGSRSPQQSSKSPKAHKTVESITPPPAAPPPTTPTVIRDSRPDIAAWPTPPGPNNANLKEVSSADEPGKLLNMLKAAAASPGTPRGSESDLKKKIQTLEDTVAEYERQKYNVMGTFSEYRERVAERERKLEAEYSNKIIALSEEVLGAKKDFEARMKSFQALQDKFEREKEQALEKLRQEHQREIQLLEQRFSESQLLNLEQKYMIEIQRLEEERKSLRAEKERLGETFEMKLRRAQSLYETELTAAKMLYSKELEALRDHEEALKEELLARQDEFHDRLQEIQHQSKRSREELATCRNEITALEKRLMAKEAEVTAISKELEEARNETNDSLRRLSKLEAELQQTKQQYRELEEELERKSNLLNIVETAKTKLEAVIRDLQTEVRALKNKVEFLEKERENLQSQSESQTQLQNSQVHALEAVLESVTKEKESTKENYEGLLDKERQRAEEREFAMKKEFSAKLNELEEQYNTLKEQLEQSARQDREQLQDKTRQEITSLRIENSVLSAEVKALKEKLLTVEQLDDGESHRQSVEELMSLLSKTDELRVELDKKCEIISMKNTEIDEMRRQVEEESELNDDQLMVIREEIRMELLKSGEYGNISNEDIRKLLNKVEELENRLRSSKPEADENISEVASYASNMNETLMTKPKKAPANYESTKGLSFSEITNEVIVRIEQLTEKVIRKQERTKQIEEAEKRLREEFESRLDERVEEESLRIVTRYEKQIEEMKVQIEEEKCRLNTEIKKLSDECSDKSEEIEKLNERIAELVKEAENAHTVLEAKNAEIKDFGKKTDEYIRKRENQQAQALEKKIVNMNKEHERTIEFMREHQEDLTNKIKELQAELKKHGYEAGSTQIEQANLSTSEELSQKDSKISELQQQLEEKSDLVKYLQKLLLERSPDNDETKARKKRSQSIANVEGISINQKQGNKLQPVSETPNNIKQLSEKPSVKEEKNAKSKEKEKPKEKDVDKLRSTSPQRVKSLNSTTRLHEQSPSRIRIANIEQKSKDDKKGFLSPSDADKSSMEDHRRGSPSRSIIPRPKTMITASSIPLPTASPSFTQKDESSRRPAWKF